MEALKETPNLASFFAMRRLIQQNQAKRVIIPGDPDHSEMIRRITATDPEVRMPYKEEPLDQHEIKILTQWIKEGAQWGDHWAYRTSKGR